MKILFALLASLTSVRAAGVVYPLDGNTRVSPSELANLCGIDKDGNVNAAAQAACAQDAAHYTFDSGIIQFSRSDDGADDGAGASDDASDDDDFTWTYGGIGRRASDAPDGELFYQLWGERDDPPGGIPRNNLIIWFNGGPGTPPSLGLQTGIGPLLFGIPPHARAPSHTYWHVNERLKVNAHGALLSIDGPPRYVGYSNRGESAAPAAELDAAFADGMPGVARDFVAFMLAFFDHHPDMRHRDLFILGESWGGQYVHHYARAMLAFNAREAAAGGARRFRLKGVGGGNAVFGRLGTMAARSEVDFVCGALPGSWSPAGAEGRGRKLGAALCASLYADLDRCARAVRGLPDVAGAPYPIDALGAVSTDEAWSLAANATSKQCDGAVWHGAFVAATPAQACSRVLCHIGVNPAWSGSPGGWDPMPAAGQPAVPDAWTGCDARARPLCGGGEGANCKEKDGGGGATPYPTCPAFTMELVDVPVGYACNTLCGDARQSNPSALPDPCRGAGCLRPVNGRHLPDPVRAFSAAHMRDAAGAVVGDPSNLMLGENCAGSGGLFPPTCHDMSHYYEFYNRAATKAALHARQNSTWLAGNFWVWAKLSKAGVQPWDNVKALLDAGVAVLLYYGKLDWAISHPRGLADAVMMHNYTRAPDARARAALAAATPYAHPRAATSALRRWPADAAMPKLGESALFGQKGNKPGRLLFVQIDGAGHEVPVQTPGAYEAVLEELLALPSRTGALGAGGAPPECSAPGAPQHDTTTTTKDKTTHHTDGATVAIVAAALSVVGFLLLACGPSVRSRDEGDRAAPTRV